ncbi:hypothetical protein E2C01_010384 [Portunus trituberculatus]|uniref:Uncharacterized protein n=1 Tax=Portunus trituberculatus TaxID=210409 RepID=A0A5B7D8B1_PORTR|nr:hypothetical protein [Portunus trituberculatus]
MNLVFECPAAYCTLQCHAGTEALLWCVLVGSDIMLTAGTLHNAVTEKDPPCRPLASAHFLMFLPDFASSAYSSHQQAGDAGRTRRWVRLSGVT